MSIQEKLKKARLAAGLTQSDAGALFDPPIPNRTWSFYETGGRIIPDNVLARFGLLTKTKEPEPKPVKTPAPKPQAKASKNEAFGEAIRQKRVEAGMSQSDFAKTFGPPFLQSDWSKCERGLLSFPRKTLEYFGLAKAEDVEAKAEKAASNARVELVESGVLAYDPGPSVAPKKTRYPKRSTPKPSQGSIQIPTLTKPSSPFGNGSRFSPSRKARRRASIRAQRSKSHGKPRHR